MLLMLLLPSLLLLLPDRFCSAEPSLLVSSKISRYMVPIQVSLGSKTYESHSSNIEEVKFVVNKASGGKMKHPNSSFQIQISRKTCRAIKLCFGHKTNLKEHVDVIKQVTFGVPGFHRKIARVIDALSDRKVYEIDACNGMSYLQWEFPPSWRWSNNSRAKGTIHYSALGAGSKMDRSKTVGISNVESIIMHSKLSGKKGLEIRHGPHILGTPIETVPAYTTFYEDADVFDKKGPVFFVLVQNANQCGARIVAPRTTHTFLIRESAINFRPGILFRKRRGVNVWSVPLGFIVGTVLGVVAGSFLLCKNGKTFYKRWNAEMKKTYGKFAMMSNVSVMTTVGGVSQMTTVGGASTIGGGGASTIGGPSVMGASTAGDVSKM